MGKRWLYAILLALFLGTATAIYVWLDLPQPVPSGARQVWLLESSTLNFSEVSYANPTRTTSISSEI